MTEVKGEGITRASQSKKQTTLSRRYIEGLISDGKHVIIFENRVLKVDAWIPFHPGGDKAIKHMVGRDATDEINACVFWEILAFGCQLLMIRLFEQTALERGAPANVVLPDRSRPRSVVEFPSSHPRRQVPSVYR